MVFCIHLHEAAQKLFPNPPVPEDGKDASKAEDVEDQNEERSEAQKLIDMELR